MPDLAPRKMVSMRVQTISGRQKYKINGSKNTITHPLDNQILRFFRRYNAPIKAPDQAKIKNKRVRVSKNSEDTDNSHPKIYETFNTPSDTIKTSKEINKGPHAFESKKLAPKSKLSPSVKKEAMVRTDENSTSDHPKKNVPIPNKVKIIVFITNDFVISNFFFISGPLLSQDTQNNNTCQTFILRFLKNML